MGASVGVDATRRRVLALAGTSAAGALAGCSGLSGDGAGGSLPADLEERVPALLERYDVPGASIALVQDGDLTWTGAFGEANPEDGRETTDDTPFRVQSITKSVTAWGVLKLVERDDIALDDPVGAHVSSWDFPEAEYSWEEVTIRRLLSHSAGFPPGGYDDVPPDEEPPSLRDALSGDAGAPAARPIDPPGSAFRYSNPGYALLELLIEDVTGRDFAAYMDDEILAPLGMADATFEWTDRVRSALATEHLVDGEPVPAYREPVRAQGMLYATAADVARFVAAGTDGTDGEPPGRGVIEPESVATIHDPAVETTGFYDLATDGAGLGHLAETLSNGERAVMNGGQGTGSWHWFHAVPATGDGIVVLTNSERSLQLIADVVGMWTDRSGLPSVALSHAARWVQLPVWLLWGVAAGLALRFGYGIISGERLFDPRSGRDRLARASLVGLATAVAGVWWLVGREVVGHFLPMIAEWLGLALAAVAVLAVVTALFPRVGDD